jgi:hypothetical protein
LLVVEQLSEFDCKVENDVFVYVKSLLVNVVASEVTDVVFFVESSECLPANLDVVGLFKHKTTILKSPA